MNGPVNWGSYPGEFLERLMAVLVAQNHPDAIRRTPASGDGGIDLMVPVDGGYEVDQVKGFTDRIGTQERRQIKKSWSTFCEDPRLSAPVLAYRLVVPVDPTPGEQQWFADTIVASADIPVAWRGQAHWDSLAAQNAHVIDYMIGGGAERVAQRSIALQQSIVNPMDPITPADVAGHLTQLVEALNRDDPHWRYDLLTSLRRPELESLPDCAMARTHRVADGSHVTLIVTAKHRYSARDSPIMGTLTVKISDPTEAEAFDTANWESFVFGRALEIPDGTLFGTITAPGGLGGTLEGAGGRLGPSASTTPIGPLCLVVVGAGGEELATLDLDVVSDTTGQGGGREIELVDAGSVLACQLRIHPAAGDGRREMNFSYTFDEPGGRDIGDVILAFRALAAVEAPNELQLRPRHSRHALFHAPITIDEPQVTAGGVRHLNDLYVLQHHAVLPLTVPDEIEPEFANQLHEFVRMLNGETINGKWTDLAAVMDDAAVRAALPAPGEAEVMLAISKQMFIDFEGQEIDLGWFTTVFARATVGPEQPNDERSVRFVPGASDSFTRHAGAIEPS
jgi:hypothetical protein